MPAARALLLLILPAAGLACLEAQDYESSPCGPADECPGELVCVEGQCVTAWPQGDFGNICHSTSECAAPYSECLLKTYHTSGVCTKTCGNKWDCPQGARCVGLWDRTYCMPACERTSDCNTLFFCLYRLPIAGGSYCYPLGPTGGGDLLDPCSGSAPCREDLVCLADADAPDCGAQCMRLCHPEEYGQAPASTCSYHGTRGSCDWQVLDLDAPPGVNAIGAACSPLCDTKAAREYCLDGGWRCYGADPDFQVCWPPTRYD